MFVWWFSPFACGNEVNGTLIGIEKGSYYSEEPSVAEKCLYYSKFPLTSGCATEVYLSIGSRRVEMSVACCQRVVKIGKTCWANILSLQVDDPCNFFPTVFNHCMRVAPEYVPGLGRKGGGGSKVPPGPKKKLLLEEENWKINVPAGCNKLT
ncbi:hypothetical protein ACLOJK_028649 [Asimina triloba]